MARALLKDYFRESAILNNRIIVASVIIVILTFAVISRLFYLQILSHKHYTTLSQENRVTLVPIPPQRGVIYDRNGVVLAQDAPAFSIEVTPDKIKNIDAMLQALGEVVSLSEREIKRFRRELKQKRRFEAVPLRFNLNDEEMARFAVNRYRFPGVEIKARMVRHYPLGELGVHALGYVGRINEAEQKKLDTNYSGTTHIGKLGIEKAYENVLHGTVGVEQVETTAQGDALRVLGHVLPVAGKDLYLTLDINLQAVAEGALGGKRGAVVAINPKSGEILAFVSTPSYDPNLFVNGISSEDYDALQTSLDKPLVNRALQGQYPPGSTVKPFYALAGLEYNKIKPGDTVSCQGYFQLPGIAHRFRDWKKEGHGSVNLDTAVAQSCDVYFYTLAQSLGIDAMANFMGQFGLGKKTGIDVPGEVMGVMPSSEWKRKVLKQPWYGGETLIAGIGQGYVLTTPLQLATITATLANNGFQMQPHMLRGTHELGSATMVTKKPAVGRRVPVANGANWNAVISSMVSVVHNPRGTAYGIGAKASYRIAGKTGTAQVASIKQGERYKESETPERLRDHALFVAFAPVDDPQIAIAVIIENGGHGSSAAAPVARTMMDYYLRDLVEAALNKQSIVMPTPTPAPQPPVTSGPSL